MEKENEKTTTTVEEKIHTWGELDFSNVAAKELGNILNMFNQRLARLERCVNFRDESGHIVTDENGDPISIERQYVIEAETARKNKAAESTAASANSK